MFRAPGRTVLTVFGFMAAPCMITPRATCFACKCACLAVLPATVDAVFCCGASRKRSHSHPISILDLVCRNRQEFLQEIAQFTPPQISCIFPCFWVWGGGGGWNACILGGSPKLGGTLPSRVLDLGLAFVHVAPPPNNISIYIYINKLELPSMFRF